MMATPFTPGGTASTVLALSKAAWRLGISLSKLGQDARTIDTTIKNLAEEVKSLGNECDLVFAELEDLGSKSETGSPCPCDVDRRIWNCLVAQVEETSPTIQELELFVKSVKGREHRFIGQSQRGKKLDKSKDQIASIRTKVCRHTDNLRITLVLINTILTHIAPGRAGRELARELKKLQVTVVKLQRSSEVIPQSQFSPIEATLLQCAREVITKGMAMYKSNLAQQSVAGGKGAADSHFRVAEWVRILESLRKDQRSSDSSVSHDISAFSGKDAHTVVTSPASAEGALSERETDDTVWRDAVDAVWDEADDDLDTDLAKAALETGTTAFEAREWEEADSLLQETLRVLQQLPKQQREFCDIFSLHYKLAVCAYHTRQHAEAEEALMSLVQQSASSDEQREYIYNVTHLSAVLYIQMGQIDRALSECEKALHGRRRLLGKQSDASLESTALMAHIYFLLDKRARAKSCLAMIPEARRDVLLKIVEDSLGTKVERPDSMSQMNRSISDDSDLASRLSTSSLGLTMDNRCYGPLSAVISPADIVQQPSPHIPSNKAGWGGLQSMSTTSFSSASDRRESRTTEEEKAHEHCSTEKDRPDKAYFKDREVLAAGFPSLGKTVSRKELTAAMPSFGKTLSRKEILDKIGCQPKDRIEDAVCAGDHSAIANLLDKENSFWRSKLRKRVRPERLTALHFAALFGEIDMANRLLNSGYNINEVPYGYTAKLTPLKIAIGARRVEMVEFLIANGAKPLAPDSWSTLAEQLMNRSWLQKTMSEAEKEYVPNRIIAIFKILLRYGWDLNMPYKTSGQTVLHQAVAFWSGDYKWDLDLRAAVVSFLCERGANPFQANTEGGTPYGIASASGHQDLLLLLGRGSKMAELDHGLTEPVELSAESDNWI